MNGSMTLGDFTAFYTYLLMLIGPMRMLGVALGMTQRAIASGMRLFEILDREPRIVGGVGAAAGRARARVELRGVSFAYGDGPDVAARRGSDGRGRVDGGAGRRDGLGQDDAGPAAAAAV